MSAPFYVSPEQWYQDKAEYARKGIARGRPIVAVLYDQGIVISAGNKSASLRKVSEIYDRIAFAGVGKFDEYESLRKQGVRYADLRGYSYCRDDVAAQSLANEYSTALGAIFTREMKPYEVELLIAEVTDTGGTFYHVMYDGSMTDHADYISIGGDADEIHTVLKDGWREDMPLGEAVRLTAKALDKSESGDSGLDENGMEVGILDRNRDVRKFQRLSVKEIRELITE